MSFINIKSIKCYDCSKLVSIIDAGVPEDLYDLIVQYKLEQLLWICKGCKTDADSNLSHQLTLVSESQIKMDHKLTDLIDSFRLLTEEVKRHLVSSERTPIHLAKTDFGYENADVGSSSTSETDSGCYLKNSPESIQPSPPNPKVNKDALPYMNEILNTLKVKEEQDAKNRDIIKYVLEDIILVSFKQNTKLSCKPYYTGSAYNNLKITEAVEFDINLVLQMPNQISLKPEFPGATFSYAKLKCEKPLTAHPAPSAVSEFLKVCSVDCYIQPKGVLSWFQKQVDFILQQHSSYDHNVIKIESRENGPARTIVIHTDEDVISVDLVPVFEFDYSVLPETLKNALLQISPDSKKHNWFMVPKQCQSDDMILLSAWRLDFPNTEKCVLHDMQCAKSIIKLLKFLRDKKDWTPLASYYIKTVVLLKVMKNPAKKYWSNSKLFERFLEATDLLIECIKNKELFHFLTKQNLIYKFNKDQCKNWSSNLLKFKSSIENDPSKLKTFFP